MSLTTKKEELDDTEATSGQASYVDTSAFGQIISEGAYEGRRSCSDAESGSVTPPAKRQAEMHEQEGAAGGAGAPSSPFEVPDEKRPRQHSEDVRSEPSSTFPAPPEEFGVVTCSFAADGMSALADEPAGASADGQAPVDGPCVAD